MKIHIRKGDTVEVQAGEFKGSQGRVVQVDRAKYRAIVEGVNEVSKHTKPSATSPQGGIIKKEAPIHISNLLLVDPNTGKGSRVGYEKDKDGNAVRVFKSKNKQAAE